MFNKIIAIFSSLVLVALGVLSAAPVSADTAVNLVPNPSLETNIGGKPASWATDRWGTNTTAFSYTNTGSHTGTYSVTTNMTKHTSGDAKWYFTAVAVKPSTSYTFSDWYKSTVKSNVDLEITTTTGSLSYMGLDTPAGTAGAWKQAVYTFTTPANASKLTVLHSLSAAGQLTTDDYSLIDNTAAAPAPAPTPTPPTVTVTAPSAGATVSGTAALTADASDADSISSVQFKIDGSNIGAPDTTAPYSADWDTTTIADGSHNITAVATNNASLSTTSSPVSVTVKNTVTPAPTPTPTPTGNNLIANPSFETAQNSTTPASWNSSSWGSNTSKFSYLTTGHTGSRSVEVQTTSYSNGAANWFYDEVPITAGKIYQYTNWYKSNVDTEVDAEVTMSDGTVQYYWLGNVFANTNWTQFKTTFQAPAGARSMAVYQILGKVGYIISDDYSLSEYTPLPYNRAIVSVTFDDGWGNQYQNAYPVLQRLGIKSTFYIISGELNDTPDYMTSAQVKNLYQNGNEIGSHTVHHLDMTTLGATKLKREFANSQTTLQNLIGVPVTDFAYPYGAYNLNTINVGKQYYASQRSVNAGLNTRDNLDVTQLKIQEVDHDVSPAQVQSWIDDAAAQHAWLILVYHEVANSPAAPDDLQYTTPIANFTANMNYLKQSGVAIEPVNQALSEVLAQQ